MRKQVRVGIDVGGTFTDVVVVDNSSREVISQLKVPTTHDVKEGVALGIINAINQALSELGILPEEVIFIAHSTTQATNALLEGDVARVGVLGTGNGLEGLKARIDTFIPAIELAPNRFLNTEHAFLLQKEISEKQIEKELDRFREAGVEVVVASEAFSVDDPENEELICRESRNSGFLATSGHEVSTLYGLRTRTRTAVINAAILPKMIHTAAMTDQCVKQAGITAPLMIMRSDGGVMSVEEVNRRPIMTMLSGPAAGIAGALMHEKVSDGIFIEVGGTSADISVIKDGKPQTKSARVGGHRTYLHTLDVRTLAIAGGSMIREAQGKIVDVGSRSAHIAGLKYACFQSPEIFEGATLVHLRPTEKDADDYIAIETSGGKRFSLTPTCAANLLEIIPSTAFAKGSREAAARAFKPLADKIGKTIEETALEVLEISCRKVADQIEELIKEYHLDRNMAELIGGGGGAASLVLFTGKIMNLPARLAKKAEVISTIGVALAMVRDTVERNIVDPGPEDILAIRKEAAEAVIKIGAVPESIEVQVEVDTRRNLVRATAFGTTELQKDQNTAKKITKDQCKAEASKSMQVDAEEVIFSAETSHLWVFSHEKIRKSFFGLFKTTQHIIRVIDQSGVIRFQRSNAKVYSTDVSRSLEVLEEVITGLTSFGDAGRSLPDVHILIGARIINLSGLADMEQALALASAELENFPGEEKIVLVASLM
ncbi:N-methylhydantoinase A/oxoprolinase/acetone carboxylase, beta subunit [Pseudarcicella hirudinis]|uniref:N-methylhydantoinase A/oxoprolinase/acetone carboxylase, beta subunit n=2 Tax=Pseudarcicella hirudinis TaxID=1079859 RepID=A0A1I5VF44_9BACT|nr:hydantoinase/oxoprolinase family protein [Pseudarcicella hirudinis]SFQ06174.1 N-methylhydantoinase A/oxoprolinase/acetone carboxylase, beta subunit [Pseudarcicella hirudinis]